MQGPERVIQEEKGKSFLRFLHKNEERKYTIQPKLKKCQILCWQKNKHLVQSNQKARLNNKLEQQRRTHY